VANRALRSDGGGVLINFIKLAVFTYCTMRAKGEVHSSRFKVQSSIVRKINAKIKKAQSSKSKKIQL